MSRYTTELRFMLENPEWTDERLGLGEYPIFDESYRKTLNQKIKDYYMFSEIGFETPARFAQRLRTAMNTIMPYYNQLYMSAKASINPFITMAYNVHSYEKLDELLQILRERTRNENSKTDTTGNKGSTTGVVTHDSQNSVDGGTDSTHHTNLQDSDHDATTAYTGKDGEKTVVGDVRNEKTSGVDETKVTYGSDIYDHGFTVNSDTPEGFMKTETIVADTYATTASKNRNRTEKSGSDTTDVTHGKITDTTDDSTTNRDADHTHDQTDKAKDIVNTEGEDVTNFGKTNDLTKWGTADTIYNEDEKGNVVGLITEIINEIENHARNQEKDGWVTYDGFSSTTMSEMLQKWRETFLNIDQMIIDELNVLFISVFN